MVPCKVTGKCGSVTVRMVPAPRGAGIVAARVPKKVSFFSIFSFCFIHDILGFQLIRFIYYYSDMLLSALLIQYLLV